MKILGRMDDGQVLVAMMDAELKQIEEDRLKAKSLDAFLKTLPQFSEKKATPRQKRAVKKPVEKKKAVPRKKAVVQKAAPEKSKTPVTDAAGKAFQDSAPTQSTESPVPESRRIGKDGKPPIVAVLRAEVERSGKPATPQSAAALMEALGYDVAITNMNIMMGKSPQYFERVERGVYRARTKIEMIKYIAAEQQERKKKRFVTRPEDAATSSAQGS